MKITIKHFKNGKFFKLTVLPQTSFSIFEQNIGNVSPWAKMIGFQNTMLKMLLVGMSYIKYNFDMYYGKQIWF